MHIENIACEICRPRRLRNFLGHFANVSEPNSGTVYRRAIVIDKPSDHEYVVARSDFETADVLAPDEHLQVKGHDLMNIILHIQSLMADHGQVRATWNEFPFAWIKFKNVDAAAS